MSGTTCASAVFLQCHWSALAPDLTFFRYVNIRLTEELVIAGFKKEPVIEVSTVTVSITLFCHG
jgi:general stress protein CsbA